MKVLKFVRVYMKIDPLNKDANSNAILKVCQGIYEISPLNKDANSNTRNAKENGLVVPEENIYI
ncbi:hypothetical protein Hanom_Chr17g01590651 [Helianthus anomalus]